MKTRLIEMHRNSPTGCVGCSFPAAIAREDSYGHAQPLRMVVKRDVHDNNSVWVVTYAEYPTSVDYYTTDDLVMSDNNRWVNFTYPRIWFACDCGCGLTNEELYEKIFDMSTAEVISLMSPDPDGTFDLLGDYYAHMQEFNLAVSLQKYLPKVKEEPAPPRLRGGTVLKEDE